LLALAAVMIGVTIAVVGGLQLLDDVIDMPRVVVPGSGEVTLAAGDHVIYGESRSELDGTAYVVNSLQLRCAMQSSDGEPIALTAPSARVSYGIGGFSGESMFATTIPKAGRYQLRCDGQGGPATLAFGTRIGTEIVVMVVGGVGGMLGAVVILLVVRRLRRRSREAVQRC
jgi:hypothetical protein